MFYTAERAARLIAHYVNKSWPENKEDLFRTLTLVNDQIWSEGSFWGMTAEFYLRSRKGPDGEYYIVSPPGYDILKAVNVDNKPVLPRDTWVQFHKNGCGSIDSSCGNWTDTVVDLGEHPTIHDIWACAETRPPKILIGACLTGEEDNKSGPIVKIQGEWDRGGEVYTYEKEKISDYRIEFINEERKFETIFGAKIALNNKIRFIENIWWKRISSITKDVTVNPVEIYAFHADSTIQLLATIPPHATESKHRRYLLPDSCVKKISCSSCSTSKTSEAPIVHALFKVSEPEEIVYPTQQVYTTSREALISLAIGVNEMFDKKSPETSIPFRLSGIRAIDAHTREKQSSETPPIQVAGPYLDDVPLTVRMLDIP